MSDPKILKFEHTTKKCEFPHRNVVTTLTFDERHLHLHHKRWATHDASAHLLHQLSPRILEHYGNESGATTQIRIAWVLLLAAIVVYYSDYNEHIPLLAPAFALLWLLVFSANIKRAWPYTWLVVTDEYGGQVAKLRAADAAAVEIKARQVEFIGNLSKAIETAKQKEYFRRTES